MQTLDPKSSVRRSGRSRSSPGRPGPRCRTGDGCGGGGTGVRDPDPTRLPGTVEPLSLDTLRLRGRYPGARVDLGRPPPLNVLFLLNHGFDRGLHLTYLELCQLFKVKKKGYKTVWLINTATHTLNRVTKTKRRVLSRDRRERRNDGGTRTPPWYVYVYPERTCSGGILERDTNAGVH